MLKKGLLAGVLILLLTATTVSSAVLLEVKDLVDIVRTKSEVIRVSERPRRRRRRRSADDPRDRLRQALSGRGPGHPARSDTLILVRLNPIAAARRCSIPRDLRADSDSGTARINAAYANGGAT